MVSDAKVKFYWALAVVFLASVGLVVLFQFVPISRLVTDLAGIPAIGSLFGALFLLARDRMAYDRFVQQEESKNRFTIGATSHMASVAFDKHVAFCEEYVGEVQRVLTTFFVEGPTRKVLPHADSLIGIRTKWAVWLTPEVQEQLVRFETAVRSIGATEVLVTDYASHQRPGQVQEMYSLLAEVLGAKEWQGKQLTGDVAIPKTITFLQKVLGIEELTRLRTELVTRALENLKNAS